METHNERICRRCAAKPSMTEEQIAKAVEQVTSMKGVKLVGEDEYERRFAVCGACDKFEYGTTCMMCGCIVQVRARLADGRCPKKLW